MTRLRERGYRQTGERFGVRRMRSRRQAVLRTCCDSDAEMYEYSECVYDTTGKVVATAEYGAYGTIRRPTGSISIYGWCGMLGAERDAATGLLFMRARYYSPMLGRFITRDPIGLSAGDINWYRYCGNAPLLAADPSGLDWRSILCEGLAWAQGFAQGFGEAVVDGSCAEGMICGFQVVGGGAEFLAGAVFAAVTAETGVGVAAGLLVAAHGSDVLSTAACKLWYGLDGDTLTSCGLQSVGVPRSWANGADAVISIVGPAGLSVATKLATTGASSAAQTLAKAKTATAASTLPKATVKATSPTVTESRKLGETVLRGVDDDCYVHFSQIEKLNSINANGLSPIGDNGANGAMYFFRVGDLKNATIQNVKSAVGELAAAGKKIDIAVIVSPNAATFKRAGNNPFFMEYSVWNGGKPFSVPVSSIIGVKGAVP